MPPEAPGATSAIRAVDQMVDRTPPERDRVVDAVRAGCIVVVIVWHWALSITYRRDGELVNPNPLDDIPVAWLLTWVFQVMPLFFVVGGFANLSAWRSELVRDGGTTSYWRRRSARLLGPIGVFVAVWLVADIGARLFVDGHTTILDHSAIVFHPLWFIGPYLLVVLLVPATASAHRRWPLRSFGVLAAAVVGVDVLRFSTGIDAIGWANLVLVWLLVHQLGYLWADETVTGGTDRRTVALAVGGLAGLVALTSLEVYPRSLVATPTTDISHLGPPTAVLPVVAALQLGVVMLLAPRLRRLLTRRGLWWPVVALNAVIMTVFLWHMTALWLVVLAAEAAGFPLTSEPTVEWWVARPVWLVVPAVVLGPLVALFAVVELRRSS